MHFGMCVFTENDFISTSGRVEMSEDFRPKITAKSITFLIETLLFSIDRYFHCGHHCGKYKRVLKFVGANSIIIGNLGLVQRNQHITNLFADRILLSRLHIAKAFLCFLPVTWAR